MVPRSSRPAADDGEATPLWLLRAARRAPAPGARSWRSPGTARRRRFSGLADQAVADVRKVLPRLARTAGRRGAGRRASSSAGCWARSTASYGGIAAVTTTVDGSLSPDGAGAHLREPAGVRPARRPRGSQIVMSHEATHVATGRGHLLDADLAARGVRRLRRPGRPGQGDVVGEPLEQPGRHRRDAPRRWRRGWPRGSSRSASPAAPSGSNTCGLTKMCTGAAGDSDPSTVVVTAAIAAVLPGARRRAPGSSSLLRRAGTSTTSRPRQPGSTLRTSATAWSASRGEPVGVAPRRRPDQRPRGCAATSTGPAARAGSRSPPSAPGGHERGAVARSPAKVSGDLAVLASAGRSRGPASPAGRRPTQARSPSARCWPSVEPAVVLVDVAQRQVGDAQRADVGPQRRQLARPRGGRPGAASATHVARGSRRAGASPAASSSAAAASARVSAPSSARRSGCPAPAAREHGGLGAAAAARKTPTASDAGRQHEAGHPPTWATGLEAVWSAGSDGTGVRHRVHRRPVTPVLGLAACTIWPLPMYMPTWLTGL